MISLLAFAWGAASVFALLMFLGDGGWTMADWGAFCAAASWSLRWALDEHLR